jgi:transcriptional regulator with XRE-family HTH domain
MDRAVANALAVSSMAKVAPDPQPTLGKALRQLRERAGLSQEALGHKAGVHPTWISALERGQSNPAWGTVRRVAAALDVTLMELVALIERLDTK